MVEGGSVIRDGDGSPTGAGSHPLSAHDCHLESLLCSGVFVDNAMDLVSPPAWTDGQMIEYYHSAISEALSYGLTSIHDAWSSPQAVRFFKRYIIKHWVPVEDVG